MSPRCYKAGRSGNGRIAIGRLAALAVAFMLEVGALANAQSPQSVTKQAVIDADRTAVAAIVMSSVAEVQLCGLAIEKTRNPDVRSFCRDAVNEHARTALAGMQLEKALGVPDVKLQPLPGTPAQIDSLAQYSGHEFDRAFLLAQIEDHENDQEEIRYAAEVATNGAVKRYENSVLPKVEKYLHLLEGALHTVGRDQP